MNDERDQNPPAEPEADADGAKPAADKTPRPRKKAAAKTGAKKAKKKRVSKKSATGAPEKKAVAKKKRASKARRKKPALDTLPPKSLVLTDEHGKASGVLPKHALVLVNRGVVTDAAGRPTGVDPRSAERAFLWLVGRRGTPGAGSVAPHQRQAQRVVEQLVRAAVIGDEPSCELIARLYEGLRPPAAAPNPAPPEQAEPPPTAAADEEPADAGPSPTAAADEEPAADGEPADGEPTGDEEPADEETAPGAPAD